MDTFRPISLGSLSPGSEEDDDDDYSDGDSSSGSDSEPYSECPSEASDYPTEVQDYPPEDLVLDSNHQAAVREWQGTRTPLSPRASSPEVPLAMTMWEHIRALNPKLIHRVLWATVLHMWDEGHEDYDINDLIDYFKNYCATQENDTSQNGIGHQSPVLLWADSEQGQGICEHLVDLIISLAWLLQRLPDLDPASVVARMTAFVFATKRIPLWGDAIDAFPTPEDVATFAEDGPRYLDSDALDDIFMYTAMQRGIAVDE